MGRLKIYDGKVFCYMGDEPFGICRWAYFNVKLHFFFILCQHSCVLLKWPEARLQNYKIMGFHPRDRGPSWTCGPTLCLLIYTYIPFKG